MTKQLKESLPVLKERYLNEIVTSEILSEEEIRKRWDFLDTGYALRKFCVLIIEIDELYENYRDNIEDMLLIKFAVGNIVEELVNCIRAGVVFNCAQDKLMVLCCESTNCILDRQFILSLVKRIQNNIEKCLNETVSIGAGGIYTCISNLSRSFNEAENALKYKLGFGNNSFISVYDIKTFNQNFYLPVGLEKKLTALVEAGKREDALSCLKEVFSNLKSIPECRPELIYTVCLNILVLISRYAVTWGEEYHLLLENEELSPESLLRIKTLDKLETHMQRVIVHVIDAINISRSKKTKGILGQIEEYIENNFHEELTLDLLANKFYMNPCYLSQLFKKELGYNFLDFLTSVRIEKAKRLLLNPELKIYEVGSMVGYNNQRYFSQIFEKYSGSTPSDYRKKEFQIGSHKVENTGS